MDLTKSGAEARQTLQRILADIGRKYCEYKMAEGRHGQDSTAEAQQQMVEKKAALDAKTAGAIEALVAEEEPPAEAETSESVSVICALALAFMRYALSVVCRRQQRSARKRRAAKAKERARKMNNKTRTKRKTRTRTRMAKAAAVRQRDPAQKLD